MTNWSEKDLAAYRKRQGQSGPQDARQRGKTQAQERESRNRWQNTVGDAYAAQNEGVRHNDGEEWFITAWKQFARNVPFPFKRQVEVRANRKMTFDFADPVLRVAVEIDGGIHGTFIHNGQMLLNREQMETDREKWNIANADGWTLLNFLDTTVRDKPEKVITFVLSVLEKRRETK